jgi:DNA-binding CsgD family transcriptional regulator
MRDIEGILHSLSSVLQLAPYKPGEWLRGLELLADATNSRHAELICWTRPNKTPFKLISNLSDAQARLIEQWEESTGADPNINPVIDRSIRAPILQTVSDTEVVSAEARKRHPVWNEFYDPLGTPHQCATPLQRDEHALLGLALLRSRSDGPAEDDERRLFARVAHAWRSASRAARTLGEDATRLLGGALDAVSATAFVLDGTGRTVYLTPRAEALAIEQSNLVLRSGRAEFPGTQSVTAECRRAGRVIEIDSRLEPCLSCMIKRHHQCGESAAMPCSISMIRRDGSPMMLQLSPLPRHQHAICFDAALLIAIDVAGDRAGDRQLRSGLAALLTPTERAVALELLNGKRPAAIAASRGVTTDTIRSHAKRIFAKAEVSGMVEFMTRARL